MSEQDAAAAAAKAAQTPWYQGIPEVDSEMAGHIQNKGWDKLTPAQAAVQATKAWKEAERFVGAPVDKILRLPDPKNEAEVKAFWGRLGAPTDAKDYDFSGVKFADGTDLDDKFKDAFRQTFANQHLPKDAANALSSTFVKFLEDAEKAELAEYTATLEGQRKKLFDNWGPNKDANLVVAKAAAKALGVTADDLGAFEKVLGYDRIMEIFRNIGTKIGEDKFVSAGTNTGIMSKDQAAARVAELTNDDAWVKRYNAGGAAEMREMTALLKIQVGDDTGYSMANRGGRE